MTHMTATNPHRLTDQPLLISRLIYLLMFVVCLSVFVLANYGQAAQFAFVDCDALYFEPEWADNCPAWRVAINEVGLTPPVFTLYFVALRVIAALPFIGLSLVLMRRRGEELRVLLLAIFLLLLGIAGPIYNPFWQWSQGWFAVENQVPLLPILNRFLGLLLNVGLVLFAFLFPDGRFVPRWGRWLVVVWIVARLADALFPDTPASIYTWPLSFSVIFTTVFVMATIGALIWRYRVRASAVERQQIKWIVLGGLLVALNYCFDFAVWEIYPNVTGEFLIATREQGVIWELVQDTLWYISQFLFAVCIGLAVFRYRLWDIDAILSRTLVYGSLTALIIALYVAIVGGLGALFHSQTTAVNGLIATGLIAILFQPLRERLQRVVNRILYGERDDPAAVFSRLAEQLKTSDTRSGILPNLAETIAHTLKIPYVAIHVPAEDGGGVQAQWGKASDDQQQSIPLVYHSETVGALIVSPRGPDEHFNRQEQQLLGTIAAITASTVRAVQLSDALQESRQRIITGREEERRRIRRDLHDGLGPSLASLPLKIDAAIDLLEQDRQVSVKFLGEVKRQAQQLVGDVRRVVHDLRPPALDELGLAEALRGALSQLTTPTNGFQLHLEIADLPADLPAAVEAASYRITMEAVTNVMRHARASHCWVSVQVADDPARLDITVQDDGVGLPETVKPNVGLGSMRERAEELGGTFQIQARAAGGTRISVRLPLS